MKTKLSIGLALLAALTFASCEADIDLNNVARKVKLSPAATLPLGGLNISIGDILNNKVDSGGSSGVNTDVFFQTYDSLEFKFREINLLAYAQTLSKQLPLTAWGTQPIPANTTLTSLTTSGYLNLGLNQKPGFERIDSALVERAVLTVTLTLNGCNIPLQNIRGTLKLPENQIRMLDANQSNTLTFQPNADGTPTEFALRNFMLCTPNKVSGFPVEIRLDAQTDNSVTQLSAASNIKLQIRFNEIRQSVAYGYFEPAVISNNTIQRHIDLKKYVTDGIFRFENPTIEITTESNLGVYLRMQVDYVKAFLTTNPALAPIFAKFNGQLTASEIFDTKPAAPGQWTTKKLRTFDKDWGGTDRLFENWKNLDMLEYKFSGTVDKELTNNDPTPNFIPRDGTIRLNVKTTIPFKLLSGSYYEFRDSIPVGEAMKQLSDGQIDSLSLILNIKNGFPLTTKLSLALLDSTGHELATDMEKHFTIQSGKVDQEGIVQPGNETLQTLTINVNQQQLETLRQASILYFTVRVEGSDIYSNIHFVTSNTFDIKASLFVRGNVITSF